MIYDVRENHQLNIASQNHYPRLMTTVLKHIIGLIEFISSYACDHFILAEQCYANEISFIKKKPYQVLENKLSTSFKNLDRTLSEKPKLIFTGNLSKTSGVDRAITLFQKLKAVVPTLTLTIIGHAPQKSFFLELKELINSSQGITLVGGDRQVSHMEIMHTMAKSHMAMVCYRINSSNKDKIPTKIYEYLGMGIPYITEDIALWTKKTKHHMNCIPINFNAPDLNRLVTLLRDKSKLTPTKQENAYWNIEQTELLNIISKVLT